MFEIIQETQISKITQDLKARVYCHLSIIGICKAIWHGYLLIVPGLLNCFIRSHMDIPSMKNFMETLEKAIYSDETLTKGELHKLNVEFHNDFNTRFYEAMMKAVERNEKGKSKLFDTPGDHSFLLSGSNLPSKILKSRKKTSLVSDYFIRGYPFILEDGQTYINQNEALEWASVYSFSPLMNGNRLNPF